MKFSVISLMLLLLLLAAPSAYAGTIDHGVKFITDNGVTYYTNTTYNFSNITVYPNSLNIDGGNLTIYPVSSANVTLNTLSTNYFNFSNNVTLTNLSANNGFAGLFIDSIHNYTLLNGSVFQEVVGAGTITYVNVLADSWSIAQVRILYERAALDIITVTENAGRALYTFRNAVDTIAVTEEVQRTRYSFRNIADSITVTEGAQRRLLIFRIVSSVITVTESIINAVINAVYIYGYVYNVLEVPLQNARVDLVGGGHSLSDATGYYNISIPAGQTELLSRAIGYRNNTKTLVVTNDTQQNFTLLERTAGTVTTPGFSGIAMIFICALIYYTVRKKRP